jgi:LysR family transcriptional regulator, benzoate and cis,cis-muconate-responsive activator of ben and cat genes
MLPSMELRHLKYFVAVAEEQNVTRAAQRLHVSQPPLSRQIRDLEQELGVKLFERGPKDIRLTPAGKVFLEESRAVLKRADDAVRLIKANADQTRQELDIAYAPSLTVQILPEILRRFQEQSKQVRVNLHDLSTESMIAGLHQGDLDVALMIDPGPKRLRGFTFEELYRYPMRAAVHPSHPLAARRRIQIKDLRSERLLGYGKTDYPEYFERLVSIFKPAGALPVLAEEYDSATSLIASVEAGRGVALVPASIECLAGPRLKLLPIVPDPAPLKIGLVRKTRPASALVDDFVLAARACRDLTGSPKPGLSPGQLLKTVPQ